MKLLLGSDDGQVVRVLVDGEITSKTMLPGDPLPTVIGANAYTRPVLLDLSKCPLMGTVGVNWLVEMNKRFKAGGGKLVVHSYPPLVAKTLLLLKMDHVLQLASSPKEAEAKLLPPSAAPSGPA